MMYEITTDKNTVWVHASNGNCIARFGRLGIDIHTEDAASCLDCTHEKTDLKSWYRFVKGMKKYYNVMISDKYIPRRLLNEIRTNGI